MYFIKIIKESIKSIKKYYIYFFIAALIGAANPFFLIIVLRSIREILSPVRFGDLSSFLTSNYFRISFYSFVIFTVQGFFPLSIFSMDVQNSFLDNEKPGLKIFFKGFGRSLLRTIIPSIFMTFIYGALTLLFISIGLFYFYNIKNTVILLAIICFIFLSYLFLLITEYFFTPMFVMYKKLKFSDILKYSMEIAVRNAPRVLLIFIVDLVILILLTLAWNASILFYFGISNILRLYMFREIISVYEFPPVTGYLRRR